jgi:hypothetical protein
MPTQTARTISTYDQPQSIAASSACLPSRHRSKLTAHLGPDLAVEVCPYDVQERVFLVLHQMGGGTCGTDGKKRLWSVKGEKRADLCAKARRLWCHRTRSVFPRVLAAFAVRMKWNTSASRTVYGSGRSFLSSRTRSISAQGPISARSAHHYRKRKRMRTRTCILRGGMLFSVSTAEMMTASFSVRPSYITIRRGNWRTEWARTSRRGKRIPLKNGAGLYVARGRLS